MRKRSARQVRDKCDLLFSEYIRKRDGGCVSCGDSHGRLECAHIKSRGEMRIRCNPLNAVTLCHSCHRRFTQHPDLWVGFIEAKYPGRWIELNNILVTTKWGAKTIDWELIEAGLKEMLKGLAA